MRTKRIPAQGSAPRKRVSAYRDPWYERPGDAALITEQFFDSRVSLIRVCPETALMYAVLEDAFLGFLKKFETERRFIHRAREAERWFFSDDSRWLFSFVAVCDALGLEPEYIRKKLKHWAPIPPVHSTGAKGALLSAAATEIRHLNERIPTKSLKHSTAR